MAEIDIRNPTKEEILADSNKYHHWQRSGEINLAMNIAKSRDRFRWALGYSSCLFFGTIVHWRIKKVFPAPMLVPLSAVFFYTAFEGDLAYGSKIARANLEALQILNHERYKYFGKF